MSVRNFLFAVGVLCICVLAGPFAPATANHKQRTIVVSGKTIIAFFPPVTKAELDKDPDTNEALSDFQYYAGAVREPLKKERILFHELYTYSFRLRVGQTVSTFRPARIQIGYYFVAPGKKPRIQYGVMTDVDLMQMANEYFGLSTK